MTEEPALTTGPVLIVGTGLLGTSIGLGLRHRGVDVLLTDSSPTAAALARDLGAGRALYPGDVPALVVVATPPDVARAVVAEYLDRFPYAVVTDVASVKESVGVGLASPRYVGSHPMAGREKAGPIAARADLFAGRPWVVAATPVTDGDALAAVRCLAIDLDAAPVTMGAVDHDRAVALISHLPQLMSSLLAARLHDADPAVLDLAGQGLRDTTRIAASSSQLWTAILAANSGHVAALLRQVRTDLDALVTALEGDGAGRFATIARVIETGNTGVARIPGKHGSAAQAYESISVLVPDRPGELARLLSEIGAAGFNLEDLHLEHAPRHAMGIAVVSVLPGVRDGLEAMLAQKGWRVAL